MATDLTGKRFGRLIVIERAQDYITPKGYRNAMWLCQCDCGNTKVIRGKSLMYGVTQSCGCLARELTSKMAFMHGCYGTRLNNIWNSMRQRCNNPRNKAYKNYGGRGIKICDEWNDFINFKKWAEENGYDETASRNDMTIDRIDVDGDYCPENCRWITMAEQMNNRRDTIFITHNGETHALSDWARKLNIKYCTLWERYHKELSPENILKPI